MMKFQKQGVVSRAVYFAINRLQESKDFTKEKVSPEDLTEILAKHYEGSNFVKVMKYEAAPVLFNGRLDPTVCNDTNNARIQVFGNENMMQVTTIIDNLGKGASGAAIQNMNIALGIDETTSLV